MATHCAKSSAMRMRLWDNALRAMSERGSWASCCSTQSAVCFASVLLGVTKITCESAPCSACESKSEATNSGSDCSSAITNTSDGPAGMSMLAPLIIWLTWRLASVTKALPGPKILSTFATLCVPNAMATTACAPPTA